MFSLFSVKAKETGMYTHITGISYYDLSKDIDKFYGTKLLTSHQIRKESWDSIRVHNFFLVELYNIVKELLMVRNLRTRRRSLNDLQTVLETNTWIKDTITPEGKTFDFNRLKKEMRTTPFEKQQEFLEQYPIITNSFHLKGLLLDADVGSGKALPLNTLVKIPGGWAAIGTLKEGDRVITPTGRVSKVVGVYHQGVTDIHQFTFEDGRVAESHPGHLWEVDEVTFKDNKEIISKGNVTTTKDIITHFGEYTYRIPLITEISGYRNLDILGARHVASKLLNECIDIDDSVLELHFDDRIKIAKEMIGMAVCHIGKTNLSLMTDTDIGADNFRRLIWSLGGIAHAPVLINGLFKVVFKHRDVDTLIEDLVGKSDAVRRQFNTDQYKNLKLKIIDHKQLNSVETVCISIDSEEKLYIIKDYLVTHNTFTALAWSTLINDDPTFVLCPPSLVDSVWVKQIGEHFKEGKSVWTSKGDLPLRDGYDYYIVHYDYMNSSNGAYLQKFLAGMSKTYKGRLKLIVDECHNFNDPKAARTKRLIEWSDNDYFAHYLPLSGTALKALGSEIFTILVLLDRFFDKKAREFFMASYGRNRPALNELLAHRIGRSKFTIPGLTGMGPPPPVEIIKVTFPGADKYTLDAIRLDMQLYISERIKFYNHHMSEFLAFYNETVYGYELTIQKDPILDEELNRYKAIVHRFRTQGYSSFTDSKDSVFCKQVEEKIEKGLKGEGLKEFRNVKSAVKYLGLKLRGEALGNVLGRARINAIKDVIAHAGIPEMIDDVEKKTLIFTSYVEALKICESYLEEKGYPVLTVYGETNKDRDEAITRFKNDPRIRALIAVIESLKEGYPMLMANLIILLNSPFRDYEMTQIVGRIWRTGQDAMCFVKLIDLDTGDKLNITTRSINIMEWSKEQVDTLLSRENNNALLGNVTGQESMDMSNDPFTRPLQRVSSPLNLFM